MLTPEHIDAINVRTLGHQHFARAIEAEVRKEYEAQEAEIARAVLDKWGWPAHSREPVAWLNLHGGVIQIRVTGHDKEHFNTPLYTASQPVEREPLTPEQRTAAFISAEKKMQGNINLSWRHAVVDEIEAAHGITQKGGQQ